MRPDGHTMLLDGGIATELQRHGITMTEPWFTSAPLRTERGRRLLGRVHAGYLAAGAEVITANTFRTNLRAVRAAGRGEPEARRLTHAAVDAALQARGTTRSRVAGSMAPVADCYTPSAVPDSGDLRREHGWLAATLVDAGVDLVLVETMNCAREAEIAVASVTGRGVPAWVSFVCGDDARLLSGEDLGVAALRAAGAGAEAVLVNCTALARVPRCLQRLREVFDGPIGVYPNVEDRSSVPAGGHVGHRLPSLVDPAPLAGLLGRWVDDYRLRIVGGCCGTAPAHIAALRAALGPGRGETA